jgi:hypothetical protein
MKLNEKIKLDYTYCKECGCIGGNLTIGRSWVEPVPYLYTNQFFSTISITRQYTKLNHQSQEEN